MKFFVVLSGLLAVVNCAEYCYNDVVGSCGSRGIYFVLPSTECLVFPCHNFRHLCLVFHSDFLKAGW
jgi:hypothetical protein